MIGVLTGDITLSKNVEENKLVGSVQAVQESTKAILAHSPKQSVTLISEHQDVEAFQHNIFSLGHSYHSNCSSHFVIPEVAIPSFLADNHKVQALHNPTSLNRYRALTYARAQFSSDNFPITTLIHGLSYHYLQYDLFERLLSTSTLPCDSIICTSKAAENAFVGRLNRIAAQLDSSLAQEKAKQIRTDLVPLGIDADLYCPRNKEDVRRLLGLPQDKLILLYFGRVCPQGKLDPAPLLLAFEEVFKVHKNKVFLVLAGNYTQLGASQVQATLNTLECRNYVEIRDKPTLPEAPLYYSSADIFISPIDTLSESFGVSLLEAMASGVPAVVSDWSGYRESVVHGVTGFHVPTYWADCNQYIDSLSPLVSWPQHHLVAHQSVAVDVDKMIYYLDVLVNNPELRHKMGEDARRHVLQHYTWSHVVSRLFDLWDELGQIANATPKPHQLKPPPDVMRSYDDFNHFPSHKLAHDDVVVITERALDVVQQENPLQVIAELNGFINPHILVAVLQSCQIAWVLNKSQTVKKLVDTIVERVDAPSATATYHILWLLKYGYLGLKT